MRTPRWLGKLAHLRGSRRRCRRERLRAQRARNRDDRQSRGALLHGFESGDMSAWSASKGLAAREDHVFTGSWAGRATSSGTATAPGTANWAYRGVGSRTDLYAQTRFKVLSQGGNQANLLVFKTASDGKLLTVNRFEHGQARHPTRSRRRAPRARRSSRLASGTRSKRTST